MGREVSKQTPCAPGETKLATATAEPLRTIFITGAASGIGRATARWFAQRGWRVGCFDINSRGLDVLRTELGDTNAFFHTLDVADRPAVLAAVEAFGAWSDGRLDLLFSNAGIEALGPFGEMAWDKVRALVEVNLLGGMSVIHAALPLLRATPGALCLSTASGSATFGTANLAVYSATKHGVKGLTEALAVELASDGVRAADLLPGIIDTGMLPDDIKDRIPTDGVWRLLPAEAVAEAAWSAYHGDKLHWYVPAELADYDVEVTTHPEKARDDLMAGRLL